jgi:hypothetical protein
MKIKFNWGTGIFIFITLFLLVNAFVIYKSLQQKYDLVDQEYYPQGLEYQKQINRFANANSLNGKITISEVGDELQIVYPEELKGKNISGKVIFFRPSDENADFTDSIKFDSAMIQRVSLNKMLSGKYIAKFFWEMDGKEFAQESAVRVEK